MNPRLSYYGDLDERKERTMKWCTYSGNGCYKYPRQYASDCLDCPYFKECIPVEPERVWPPEWCDIPAPACPPETLRHICETCCWYKPPTTPDSSWAQRAGMAWWEMKGWFVARLGPQGGAVIALASATEMEAQEWLKRDPSYRAFKWQDGLR